MDTKTPKVSIIRRRAEGPFAYRRELGQSIIRSDNRGADRKDTVDSPNPISRNVMEGTVEPKAATVSVADLVRAEKG